MKPLLQAWCIGWCVLVVSCGKPTPLDRRLVEQRLMTITCELRRGSIGGSVPVFESVAEYERAEGIYHYRLWLPSGYLADPNRRWPCLFIASPHGDAEMGPMEPWLKANGFVVVLLVESKNGPWEPIVGNFLAAHDDVISRVRIQEGRKIATGQSGGARASSVFVQLRPGFCGLIMQGAGVAYGDRGRYHVAGLKRQPDLRMVLTMGNLDSNREESPRLEKALFGAPFRVLPFRGGHTWAPAPIFERAITWILEEEGNAEAAQPAR